MIIVGIDPSLTSTGIAIVDTDDPLVIDVHRVESKGHAGDTWVQRLTRIESIADRVFAVVAASNPDGGGMVVLESPSYGSKAGSVHDRSGAWWAIYSRLHHAGSTVVPVPPTNRAKYATGSGRSNKDTVMLAASRRYPHAPITDNNEADAVILAAIGARIVGQPIEESLPQAHLAALTKLTPTKENHA